MTRFLKYPLYQRGQCGWSNALMSIECGIILAHLTDRTLVLSGNISPPANINTGGRMHDRLALDSPLIEARVTDLYEMPFPWIDLGESSSWSESGLRAVTLTSAPLFSSVFYLPRDLDTGGADFLSFANGRSPDYFLTYPEHLREVDVLELDTVQTLSNYSYLFYLPETLWDEVHRVLRQLQPKEPYRAFAQEIIRRLGEFNAVHIRLGDFRQTVGVTTKLRSPHDVIAALLPHFSTDETLVICTDESDNQEFFGPIREAYPKSLLLDSFILKDKTLSSGFLELPFHGDMAMALITQLVAAASSDFIGSMTSTFTGVIQRMRGSRGLREDFKFLWCEVPDQGARLEPGAHPDAVSIPFKDCRLVETRDGPYSWNRLDLWVGPEYYAWFREWPESFLGADT